MTTHERLNIRIVLAVIWLVTGALSFGLYPVEDSLMMLQGLGLPEPMLLTVLYVAAALDVAMGVLTLAWPRRLLWLVQAAIIVSYSLLATWLVPEYWLHPFAPLLKNLAVLALLWLLYRHERPEEAA